MPIDERLDFYDEPFQDGYLNISIKNNLSRLEYRILSSEHRSLIREARLELDCADNLRKLIKITPKKCSIYNLINNWYVKEMDTRYIVYSEDNKILGFTLSSDDSLNFFYENLIHAPKEFMIKIPFLSEILLELIIKEHSGFTLQELIQKYPNKINRLRVLTQHPDQVKNLLLIQKNIEDIMTIEDRALNQFLQQSYKRRIAYEGIEKLLTISSDSTQKNPSFTPNYTKNKALGNYIYNCKQIEKNLFIKITVKGSNNNLNIKINNFAHMEHTAYEIDHQMYTLNYWGMLGIFMNFWYKNNRLIYASDIDLLIEESWDEGFPIEKFRSEAYSLLNNLPYYKAYDFSKYIESKGFSLELLKEHCSLNTIIVMCNNRYALNKLITHGLNLNDLNGICQNKLMYMLNNFSTFEETLVFYRITDLLKIELGTVIKPSTHSSILSFFSSRLFNCSSSSISSAGIKEETNEIKIIIE